MITKDEQRYSLFFHLLHLVTYSVKARQQHQQRIKSLKRSILSMAICFISSKCSFVFDDDRRSIGRLPVWPIGMQMQFINIHSIMSGRSVRLRHFKIRVTDLALSIRWLLVRLVVDCVCCGLWRLLLFDLLFQLHGH